LGKSIESFVKFDRHELGTENGGEVNMTTDPIIFWKAQTSFKKIKNIALQILSAFG
jgi:hypothetical protein